MQNSVSELQPVSLPSSVKDTPTSLRISRAVLYDEVLRRLHEMIFEGQLSPGSHISERHLCEQFGISRTPLREALKVLASEGLVELLPNRGARVTRLSAIDVEHMFQVMGALEGLVGEITAERINTEDLTEIQSLHEQMVACYKCNNRIEYFRFNQLIHEKIIAVSDNPVLISMYNSLSGRIRRARYMTTLKNERWDKAVEEHEQMIKALEERDGTRLSAILKGHLKLDSLKEQLDAST